MSKTTTEMQLISIDKLVPYVNNARTHSAEQIIKLRSSLREFGFVNPIIIDRDFNVIAGHGRLMAAKEEGINEVPCVFVDFLTDAQKKAYILADNRMAMDAGWDEELLKIEMEELQNLGYDLGYTGFDEKELADLFGIDDKEVKDDEFDLTAALQVKIDFQSNAKALYKRLWGGFENIIYKHVEDCKYVSVNTIAMEFKTQANIEEYKARSITEVIIASMDSFRKR